MRQKETNVLHQLLLIAPMSEVVRDCEEVMTSRTKLRQSLKISADMTATEVRYVRVRGTLSGR